MKNVVIILAGGYGERFGGNKAKQFVKIGGKTIIEHTIDKFEKHKLIDEILIVVNPNYYDTILELIKKNEYQKVRNVIYGGKRRADSSMIGINSIAERNDVEKVLIHDAVRPFVSNEIITRVINALDSHCAVDVAVPVTDTIIKVDDDKFISDIPVRKHLFRGQTPQGFKKDIIVKAYKLAQENMIEDITDDCGLVLKYGLCRIFVVDGEETNMKITYPHDIYIADRIFQLKTFNSSEVECSLDNLMDKVVVIFGGTIGIGKEIDILAKQNKAKTYVFSRHTGVDVSKYDQVEKALEQVHNEQGKIDIVIDSAGVLKMSPLYSTSIDDINEQINTNLLGAIYVAKASIPYLKETKGSFILFTSSSYTRGRENYSPYSSSKAGVVNFTQALADELSIYKVRVNAICPERTATPMRIKNFGFEPKDTLLDPKKVALITLKVALLDITGQVIDVRRE